MRPEEPMAPKLGNLLPHRLQVNNCHLREVLINPRTKAGREVGFHPVLRPVHVQLKGLSLLDKCYELPVVNHELEEPWDRCGKCRLSEKQSEWN